MRGGTIRETLPAKKKTQLTDRVCNPSFAIFQCESFSFGLIYDLYFGTWAGFMYGLVVYY